MILESELDGLLVHQEAGDLVTTIVLGNAQTRPDEAAHDALNKTDKLLIALDADKAGAKEAWGWWRKHYPRSERWPCVGGKDPGEMYQAGMSIRQWVQAALLDRTEATGRTFAGEATLTLGGQEIVNSEPKFRHGESCESIHLEPFELIACPYGGKVRPVHPEAYRWQREEKDPLCEGCTAWMDTVDQRDQRRCGECAQLIPFPWRKTAPTPQGFRLCNAHDRGRYPMQDACQEFGGMKKQ